MQLCSAARLPGKVEVRQPSCRVQGGRMPGPGDRGGEKQKPQNAGKTLRRLLKYMMEYGWIFFILLVIVGHVLNIAMCALGAFVHPLRLNFLEFFKNAGYEGGGRKYTPLAKENTNN